MMANGAMGSESGGGLGDCNFLLRSYITSWLFFLIVTDVIGFLGYFAKNVGI